MLLFFSFFMNLSSNPNTPDNITIDNNVRNACLECVINPNDPTQALISFSSGGYTIATNTKGSILFLTITAPDLLTPQAAVIDQKSFEIPEGVTSIELEK
jgi:hypothetical protein